MRTWLQLGFAAVLGASVGACFDDELTLNTECITGEDCGPGQVCFGTPYQDANMLNAWCRPSEECAAGEQPGCRCEAGDCVSSFDGFTLIEVAEACVSMTNAADLDACEMENPVELNDCICVLQPTTGT